MKRNVMPLSAPTRAACAVVGQPLDIACRAGCDCVVTSAKWPISGAAAVWYGEVAAGLHTSRFRVASQAYCHAIVDCEWRLLVHRW